MSDNRRTVSGLDVFASVPEQLEAKRLLASALQDGSAHAFLLHGPAGTGKRTAATALAGALLGDPGRVAARTHPDLYVVEPLGEWIRIDEIRALRHDLHMRPYEGDRRVYLVHDAHRLNSEAADALLKDLEEPPDYATIVLVASELGSLPETITSRCQLVPFKRLSEGAVRAWLAERAPELPDDEALALARVAGGRLDRARRLLDPEARARRQALIGAARGVYGDDFDPGAAARVVLDAMDAAGAAAREAEESLVADSPLSQREAEQRVKRAGFGAERDELLASLEELEAWYRDLVVVGAGAERAALHPDQVALLRADAAAGVDRGAEEAAGLVRESWRSGEEYNVNASLALESLFVRLRRAFSLSG